MVMERNSFYWFWVALKRAVGLVGSFKAYVTDLLCIHLYCAPEPFVYVSPGTLLEAHSSIHGDACFARSRVEDVS